MEQFTQRGEVPVKFRHKPTVVTAIQLLGETTVEGPGATVQKGNKGDWLVQGPDGDTFICTQAIFDSRYDAVKPRAKKS